jgi:hypothetical protein
MSKKKITDQVNDNVIPFPGLTKKLIEKGLHALERKKFREAAQFFMQAKEFEPDHPDLNVGLVVSLVEIGHYEDAKVLCKELLQKGLGDYFQVVNIYLMILLHLNEHEEMVTTIEALFDEKEIPPDKEEQFERMLQFSKRVMNEKLAKTDKRDDEESTGRIEDLTLSGKNERDQLFVLSRLADRNIRQFVEEIHSFLKDKKAHPFLKTMAINILREQGYEKEVVIEKFSRQQKLIPANLPELSSTRFLLRLKARLEEKLEQINPTLMELAISILERHQFLLYPFLPEEHFDEWAAAYHFLASEYQGLEPTILSIAEMYSISLNELEQKIKSAKELEEISSPII